MKKTAERHPQPNRQAIFVCALLALATLLAFFPVRRNQFLDYDDQQYITENPQVLKGLTWDGAVWAFTASHSANWHPVTWLSHMLDVQLFGLNPAAHHAVNVLLHTANAILLFLLFFRMTGALRRSAVVAFLFALHPMHVESVAWAAERKDVLSTLFGLLSLLAYWRYATADATQSPPRPAADTPGNGRPRFSCFRSRYYWVSLFCFALALMSKPMLVTLPGVMLLLDFWPLRRLAVFPSPPGLAGKFAVPGRTLWRLCVEKVPWLLLVALSAVITILVQRHAMMYFKDLPPSARVANAVVSYLRYLELACWPTNLAVLYPHPAHWPAMRVAAASAFVILASGVSVWSLKRRPYVAVGWFWYVGMLVPVLGLVQVGIQSLADRYSYLPLVGIFIIVAWGGADLLARLGLSRNWGLAAAAGALGICALLTARQVRLWRDTKTLFIHTAHVTSRNWFAEYKLAVIALKDYETAGRAQIADQLSQTADGSRRPTAASDSLQEAIQRCQTAMQWDPRILDIHLTLAKALTEAGRVDEAEAQLQVAVRIDPKNPDARANLAEILHRKGRTREAVSEYQAALALNPDWQGILNNLAWILATDHDPQIRDGAKAVRLAERACNLASQTNLWFQHTRAAAYAEQGNFSNAVAAAQKALRLAEATGNPEIVKTAASRVDRYRKSQPLRAP